jgi:FtsH-binding integral membrane protein
MNYWNDNYQNGFNTAVQAENEITLQRYVNSVMRRVYVKMTMGLLVTTLTALMMFEVPGIMDYLMFHPMLFYGLAFVELGLVFTLSARVHKMNSGVATVIFYLYSMLNGVTMAPIFQFYTSTSIVTTFAITAGTFGAMTIFGYFTRQDLSKFGTYLFMALIGLIVCTIVNLFMHSTMMDWLISGAGVLIFVGLTAWDTQAIKRMCAEADPDMANKLATFGALSLYLDFINLFLYLLRFFGSRD